MGASPKQLSKWLGNGVPNISRVIECTKERITLIGLGALKKDEGDIFRLPLPVDFSSRLMKRKLTVTLSYLSPIAPNKQTYRGAQLWFNIDDSGKGLVPDRQNTEWQAVRKGSLQHEIFIGENPIVWNDDDLIIKVNCKEEANKIKTKFTSVCKSQTIKKREYSQSDEPKSCTPFLCVRKCLKSSLFLHVPASRPTHEKS